MNKHRETLSLPTEPRQLGFYIDGQMRDGGSRSRLDRVSPAHDVVVSSTVLCTSDDVDEAVAVARRVFEAGTWSRWSGAQRAAVLLKAAAGIRENLEELAYWETLETGKAISQSRAEIGDAAGHYEYAAGVTRTLHGDAFNNLGDAMFGLVTRQPIGVIGLIIPWNFPFIILAERIPYMLAAGCTIVCKPSELTSTTTVRMAEILSEAGLPNGVFNVVTGTGPEVGKAMTEHDDVDMMSFTGSLEVGRKALIASAGNIKKLGLELGGKNPQIVFADADLEDAADGVVFGLCFNAGQCCVSGSRLVVEKSIADGFSKLVAEKLSRVRIGDVLDPDTQLGAIVSPQHFEKILGYIESGKSDGATVVFGGGAADTERGRYVTPTLLANVERDMAVARDEIFGPVLTMQTFETVEEAIGIANDNVFGLAASIWTKNIDKAIQTMRRVHAGRTWVNTTITGGPELPIGGFKQSGTGRETGVYGVEEYTEVKSIHIAIGKRDPWVK